ncbi:MAG: hypothetical protein K8I27_13470 [Planctomycetes bacterium]|nr:hypothetical protein [Planctomycetota bacterium]
MATLISLLGFALVVFGAWLFMPDAPVVPVLSAGDMPGLIVMFLGAGWSLLGTVQFMRFGRGFMAKGALILLLLLSLVGTGGISWWVLAGSDVPAPVALEDKPVPAFELTDQNGEVVSDVSLRDRPVVLIFTRGVW